MLKNIISCNEQLLNMLTFAAYIAIIAEYWMFIFNNYQTIVFYKIKVNN